MPDGQIEGNSAVATAEPVTGQAASATTETPSQNGQAATQAQSAPAEERFSSVDPNTLPPELQSVYKSLQADYTKKVMPIAELRKKADGFDQITARPDFKDFWSGMTRSQKAEFKEQKAEVEKSIGQKISDEEFTKAFENKDAYLSMQEKIAQMVLEKSQKQIQSLQEKLSVKEAQDLATSFATEVGRDGKPLRPDFDSLEEDNLISGYLSVNQPENASPEAQVAKLQEAYQWAKSLSQKYYEKGRVDALARIQQKAATSTEPPTSSAKGAYTGPKMPSVREAIELAKKGQRVVRDD
jgi:hypothetical protein